MDDTLKQRMRAHLKENEGVKEQPYRDSNKNLTVGVGLNVSRKEDFVALKFQVKDVKTGTMRDATEQEKGTEFDRLAKMSRDDIADDKNGFTLPKTEIDAKLDEKIASTRRALRVRSARWTGTSWPMARRQPCLTSTMPIRVVWTTSPS